MKYLNISIMAFVLVLILFSCQENEKTWQLTNTIQLEGINPIGIASLENEIWLSDGDHNRVVKIDSLGKVITSIDSLDRPMHIDGTGTTLFIPQYGNDLILKWSDGKSNPLVLLDSLDAPAGVSVYGNEIAIADFYNNRILYSSNGKEWKSFGEEGKENGQFYYPTDVQITEDKIWVADAYNNRVQAFDKNLNFLRALGSDQNMNATTGIFVDNIRVYATDFENDRILIFDHEGNLEQELNENIEKPTDLIVVNNKLYTINYRNGLINIFELKKI